MKKLIKLSVLSLVLSLPAQSAVALKVGVVNIQKALQEVNKGKKATASLEKKYKAKKAEFAKQEKELKKLDEEFQKKSLVLSDAQKNKKRQELQKRFIELQQGMQKAQVEMQQANVKLTQPILKEMTALIPELGKKEKVALVLEASGSLLYAADRVDLTSKLISLYNKKHK